MTPDQELRLLTRVAELEGRVASLEKVSHAPVDLRPVIREELRALIVPSVVEVPGLADECEDYSEQQAREEFTRTQLGA